MTRLTLWLSIPMTVLLPAWLWIGRIVFGVGGWGILILLPVALALLVMLLITTILAFTQHAATSGLTGFQTVAHVVTWLIVIVTGAVMPDFGDAPDSQLSLLTQVFGYSDGLYDASVVVALLGLAAGLVAWVVLLVSVTAGRRKIAS